MTLGPLALIPRLVEKPWGGRRLADLGRDLPDGQLVGESWDVADLDPGSTSVPDPVSRVASGPYAGRTLAELVATEPEQLLGRTRATAGSRFPLLVKHLDAREHLSVQVHPSEAVLAEQPGGHLKTESWVVVHAEPGAELLLGVVEGVTPDDVEAAFGTPDLVSMVRRVPAEVGDVHHVPAGLLHALGAGVLVAEVQTPSDTTYRLYDWTGEYGRAPRELHRERAMRCLRVEWEVNSRPPAAAAAGDGLLVDTAHYRISRSRAAAAVEVEVPARDHPRVVIGIAGSLGAGVLPARLGPAGVVLLPAGWSGSLPAAAGSEWLDIDLV